MKSQESLISVDNLPEYILEYFGIIFKKSFYKIKPDYPIFPNIAQKNAKKKTTKYINLPDTRPAEELSVMKYVATAED